MPLGPDEVYPDDPFVNDRGFAGPAGNPVLPCPPQTQAQAQAQAQAASAVAIQGWEAMTLSPPDPRIAPGWAITGKWAYLETRNRTAEAMERDTPVGQLRIEATGVYYVDWGDGTSTGPHHDEGGPWPSGEIRHQYTHVGRYDVVVTERWAAQWTLGQWSGSLSSLATVATIEDFEVRQIQAVIVSG